MKIFEKTLSDTDSIYCQKPTSSHQTSIFIAQTNSDVATSLFGRDYESNLSVVVEFSKTNLLLNLLFHFLEGAEYFKRESSNLWIFDKAWLSGLQEKINDVFGGLEHVQFRVSVNKETSRTYLKGLANAVCVRGTGSIDLRNFLFSGDVLKLSCRKDGVIVIAIANRGGENTSFIIEDYRKSFINWLSLIEKKAKSTVDNYLTALDYVGGPIPEDKNGRTTGKWPGIYEYLTGTKVQSIYNFGTEEDLQLEYGMFDLLFADSVNYGPLSHQKYDECREWCEKDNHRILKNGYFAYKRFVKWREVQKKHEDNKSELPPNVDRLSIALKLFAEKRKEEDGWLEGGRKVNAKIREYFDVLTVDELKRFDKEKITELFLGKKDADGKVVFNPMWSGSNGSGWNNIELETESDVAEVVEALVKYKEDAGVSAVFCDKGFLHPKGFGLAVISELLMKFHPDSCFKCGRITNEVMNWLGLIDFPNNSNFSADEYKQMCGVAALILEKMKAMKIPRQIHEDGSEDNSPPDYLTVNEFIWFVSENKDLIKEKIMAKKMNPETAKKREKKGKPLSFAKDSKEDELLLRLLSALRAKPFAILAGHSGTGKSRYVKKLAYMTCNGEGLYKVGQLPGNYLLLQVKPNWHDSTELLGFRNAMDSNKYQKTQLIEFLFKAYHYKNTPFFLCLDEMNLAPVEQYFAEFLSAMESKEPVPLNDITADEENLFELGCEWNDAQELLNENGFSIPKNLFIVGTVNMDETTNQFSRKVLDRAFTIEMTDVDFTKFGDVKEPSDEDLVEDAMIEALLNGKEEVVTKLDEEDMSEGSSLIKVQSALKSTSFAIAYRFANEYTLLKRAIKVFDKDNVVKLDALDQAVLMKILPRIAGEDVYINKVYGENDSEGLRKALEDKNASLTKINEIMTRAKNMNAQYITFWP